MSGQASAILHVRLAIIIIYTKKKHHQGGAAECLMMVYSIDATTAMQTRGLVYEVWVRLESSRHSFLGKKMFDRQGSYHLKSIEIN